jgi:hypothetical protein
MSETTTAATATNSQRPVTYFDISIAGEPAGRIIFQLYNDLVPKTAENFRPSCPFHSSTPHAFPLRLFSDRRTLHWREGHWQGRKAAMVQGQRLSSRH